ncbi:MAG: hypothetical protein IJS54_01000 [Desulfovibrio sp.]|nr:hypothetical protein [Desulfovibrio sp.]
MTLTDGTEIKIEGLKANLFLDISIRLNKIGLINNKILEEKTILEKAIEEKFVPSDIKNTMLFLNTLELVKEKTLMVIHVV